MTTRRFRRRRPGGGRRGRNSRLVWRRGQGDTLASADNRTVLDRVTPPEDSTLMRIHGIMSVHPIAGDNVTHDYNGWLYGIVAPQQLTSFRSPTDFELSLPLVVPWTLGRFNTDPTAAGTTINVENNGAAIYRVEFDSKAMRRLDENNKDVVLVFDNRTVPAEAVHVSIIYSMLFRVP